MRYNFYADVEEMIFTRFSSIVKDDIGWYNPWTIADERGPRKTMQW